VEHETSTDSGNSSSVTLCVSKCRLSLLAVSPDDDDVFAVQAEYSTASIVCWKLHFVDRQRCHIAYLSVTVAPDQDPANCNYSLRRYHLYATDVCLAFEMRIFIIIIIIVIIIIIIITSKPQLQAAA